MGDMVKICTQAQVKGETEKAICVLIGKTFDSQPIVTWYPKSACQIRPVKTGYELWAPAWMGKKRMCAIGNFGETPGPGFYSAKDYFSMPF